MKKFSLFLAAVLLASSMVSCGGDEGTTTDTSAATGSESVADTSAAVTEPATTEEVTTAAPEPEMVEVFTSVSVDNFDDAEATKWKKNAQISDFAVADGYLACTSTGGDPSIATKTPLDLNCEDIHAIRVRYLNGSVSDAIQLFFTTDTNTSYSEPASFKETTWNTEVNCDLATIGERTEDEWDTVVFYTEGNEFWTGTLKNVRIDLSSGEGPYVIDYVSFDTVTYEEAAQ